MERPAPLAPAEAAERYRVLQECIGRAAPELRRDDDAPPERFAAFVARAEALLNAYAREHRHGDAPLLEGAVR